ncbi:37S ribosomal protein S24, mitochondrial [Actinomortierella ambigua]|uniref:37S ribosomal protein S24, mitochondrial n=1 Tax=Actinomortierella ambigua TaxID=1343610 RepID=A0A9P6PXA8_9FUNG|nr:37S ribosomal protein S24, mitochondrial [Actinomortierella ambigua]KAG0254654.1 37S ribosomal protein S24, mitochondrial [Actinomortierella ambigua]
MLRTLTKNVASVTMQANARRTFMTSALMQDRPRSSQIGADRGSGASKDGLDISNLEDFKFDDSAAPGYDNLEAIREVRKYLRLIKYELPKLKAYSKPFQPPTKSQILNFRTMTYIGEANHPAAAKVVMTVKAGDLPLTDPELHKFLLLAGPRYNPHTKEIKMSCEKFQERSQNFKWLSDTLDKLVDEAKKNPEQMADLPLDLRHAEKSFKPRVKFPKEWRRPVKADTAAAVESA